MRGNFSTTQRVFLNVIKNGLPALSPSVLNIEVMMWLGSFCQASGRTPRYIHWTCQIEFKTSFLILFPFDALKRSTRDSSWDVESTDVVWLSWLTHLFNVPWSIGATPVERQTEVVGSVPKKLEQRVCSSFWEIAGKDYSQILERRLRTIQTSISVQECSFHELSFYFCRVAKGIGGTWTSGPCVLWIWRRLMAAYTETCSECTIGEIGDF